MIYFQVWVVYFLINESCKKYRQPALISNMNFPEIKKPLREVKAIKLFRGIFIIRIAGSELLFGGDRLIISIIRM